MTWIKLNNAVSYWDKPSLGTVDGKKPIMALTVDKSSKPYLGIARVVKKRAGNVDAPGYVDKSKLVLVKSQNGLRWHVVGDLKIKGIEGVIKMLNKKERYFIGLEDPDIIIGRHKNKHIFFTIAFKIKTKVGFKVYLGHAKGETLETLKATRPSLKPKGKYIDGFKELCMSPLFLKHRYFALDEEDILGGMEKGVTVVSLSYTKNLNKPFIFKKIILDPRKEYCRWIHGNASPCRILEPKIIKHRNLLVGIVNGREPTRIVSGKRIYGKFQPGLFLFNPKTGEIPWVAPKPLFEDPKATTITFASDYLPLNKKEILLYCHVNDSFVRAYKINLGELRKLIPKNLNPHQRR